MVVALEALAAPRMTREEYLLLNEFITDQFGITFPDHKREMLESRLRPRLKALHLSRYWDYYLYLNLDRNGERSRLAEAVTNNETFFFRETHQFDDFFAHLGAVGAAGITAGTKRGGHSLRVLCAGCSSGEEPYTLGIFSRLNTVPLGGKPLEIDAFDIDGTRIATAQSAEYGRSSLRALTPEQVARYLQPVGPDRWSLRPAYRTGVRFSIGNILDLGSYPAVEPYDALFCRNVLIYFSEAALRRAVQCFGGMLRPGGLLFLGAAESIIGLSDRFETVRFPHTIAYRRRPD